MFIKYKDLNSLIPNICFKNMLIKRLEIGLFRLVKLIERVSL